MTNLRENQIIGQCLSKLIKTRKTRSVTTYEILEWVEDNDGDTDFEGRYRDFPGDKADRVYFPDDWIDAQAKIKKFVQAHKKAKPDFIDNNVELLSEALNVDRAEKAILHIAYRCAIFRKFESFCEDLISDFKIDPIEAVTLLTDLNDAQIKKALHPSGLLMRSNLIKIRSYRQTELGFEGNSDIFSLFSRPLNTVADILDCLAKPSMKSSTEISDFPHHQVDVGICQNLLQTAVSQNALGINILIFGAPGTGKTELSKTLTQSLNLQLYQLAESESNDEPSRRDRLNALNLCQQLTRHSKGKIFLFDEMEDINHGCGFFGRQNSSKVFMNRLLEENPTPVIWISNETDSFDNAFLRRFTFSFEMRKPPKSVTRKIWGRLYNKHKPEFPEENLEGLINTFDISPAHIDTALRAAKLAKTSLSETRHIFKRQSQLCNMKSHRQGPVGHFNLDLINSEKNIPKLTEYLLGANHQAFSLCISGPPGTGKSAYGRYLAEQLELPVLYKRGSDLLGMYVGQSEKNIAAAFEEALDTKSFLIFDEVDSLLANRDLAQRNWEVSQVNEMLTQMESHKLPFLATTNLSDRLDPAAIRRFTFKLTFNPLSHTELAKAYKHFFKSDAPHGLKKFEGLTSGDFHVVRKRCRLLGLVKAKDILRELEIETRSKTTYKNPIGFNSRSEA